MYLCLFFSSGPPRRPGRFFYPDFFFPRECTVPRHNNNNNNDERKPLRRFTPFGGRKAKLFDALLPLPVEARHGTRHQRRNPPLLGRHLLQMLPCPGSRMENGREKPFTAVPRESKVCRKAPVSESDHETLPEGHCGSRWTRYFGKDRSPNVRNQQVSRDVGHVAAHCIIIKTIFHPQKKV